MRLRIKVFAVSVVGVAGMLALTANVLAVVRPVQDDVEAVDVIVVLAGAEDERLTLGLRLWQQGLAPALVVSSVPSLIHAPETTVLCQDPPPGVECFTPEPVSTRGEAHAFRDLAAARGWRSTLVVTSTSHVTRARQLVHRCFPGAVRAVGADGGSAFETGRLSREVGALLVSQVDRKC